MRSTWRGSLTRPSFGKGAEAPSFNERESAGSRRELASTEASAVASSKTHRAALPRKELCELLGVARVEALRERNRLRGRSLLLGVVLLVLGMRLCREVSHHR